MELNTLTLLKTIDTKWVVNKEDYMVTMEKEDWTNIIDEVVNNDIDYCNLTKVNEYGVENMVDMKRVIMDTFIRV